MMANLEQLPSGSYRYRKKIHGKVVRVTFDHKPSKNEIMIAVADKIKDMPAISDIKDSFISCAESYMNAKSSVLSPSTKRGYRTIINAIPDDFKEG